MEKIKDNSICHEYSEADVQDNIYESVLKQAYSMYKLFNGTFNNTLEKRDVNTLISKFDQFYDTVSTVNSSTN